MKQETFYGTKEEIKNQKADGHLDIYNMNLHLDK